MINISDIIIIILKIIILYYNFLDFIVYNLSSFFYLKLWLLPYHFFSIMVDYFLNFIFKLIVKLRNKIV